MSQRLVILIIILILALAGAGVWWYFNQDQVRTVLYPTTNQNQNTNSVANTNLGPVNGNLAVEQQGASEIDYSTTVGGVELHFSSASKVENFAGKQASEGKSFVVVYFDAVTSDQVLTVQTGLSGEAGITYRGGSAPPGGIKVASDVITGDRGYIRFEVPTDATDLQLEFGDDRNRRVALPL